MKVTRTNPATSVRMAGVRQRGTKIESAVAVTLRDFGLHYRKNVKRLPGSPDFANHSAHWAIFVNGCFWHHHAGCRKATVPKSNTHFWTLKFRDNQRRDARAIRSLRRDGYHVATIWECQIDRVCSKLSKFFESCGIDAG